VAGDRHVVVVDQQLHVEPVGHRKAGRLGVIPLLLGAVGAQAHQHPIGIRQGQAVHERPEVAEATGTEGHPGGEAQLRVAGQAGMGLAVAQQGLGRQMALQHRHQILNRHPVAGLIKEDRSVTAGPQPPPTVFRCLHDKEPAGVSRARDCV
jgi:hypothetical protein